MTDRVNMTCQNVKPLIKISSRKRMAYTLDVHLATQQLRLNNEVLRVIKVPNESFNVWKTDMPGMPQVMSQM